MSINDNERLMEKQQLVKDNIKQLQTIDNFLLKEMQNNDSNQGSYLAHIKNLSAIRQNLFELLKNEYDNEIDKVKTSNEKNKDSNTLLKISEDALNKKKKDLKGNEERLINKKRMIKIGNYEFERYQKHKQVMKVLAYTSFGVFLSFFLQKQQIIPEFLSKICIIFSSILGIIFLIKLSIDIWYRNNLVYSKYDFGFFYEPKNPSKRVEQDSRWSINKRGFYKLLGWGDWDGRKTEQSKELIAAQRSFAKQNKENDNPSLELPSFEEQLNNLFEKDNCPPEAERRGYCDPSSGGNNKDVSNSKSQNMCTKYE